MNPNAKRTVTVSEYEASVRPERDRQLLKATFFGEATAGRKGTAAARCPKGTLRLLFTFRNIRRREGSRAENGSQGEKRGAITSTEDK